MRSVLIALLAIVAAADATSDKVAALVRALEDPARPWHERRKTVTALATIGTPDAVAAIERVLATERARPHAVWAPPSASSFLDMVGSLDIEAARLAAALRDDTAELLRLNRAAHARRVSTPGGRSFVVFADPWLGNARDLWLTELDDKGRASGATLFLGPGSPCQDCPLVVEAPDEHYLRITRTDFVTPGDVVRDDDGDGLTDVVERRMRLDPYRADTDGDGLVDSKDPAPNATVRLPRSEDERDLVAIFEQYFLFGEENAGLAVFVGDTALEWRGRRGPTITLTEAESAAFQNDAPRIAIRRAEGTLGGASPPALAEGEQAYRVGAGAGTCDVVLRRVGERRVIRAIVNCIAT